MLLSIKSLKKNDEIILVKSDKNSSNKRFSVFSKLKNIKILEVSIPKFKKFNSSEMRKMIYEKNKKEFIKFLPEKLNNKIKNKIWKLL